MTPSLARSLAASSPISLARASKSLPETAVLKASTALSALSKVCGAEALGRDQLAARHFDVVVHATPLGMYPHVNECFFPDKIPGEVVFDMVYNPLETLLDQRAREQGKTVIPGLEMFIEQASHQFELWTGDSAPRAVMHKAALEALEQQR